jgi:hypothetical protein
LSVDFPLDLGQHAARFLPESNCDRERIDIELSPPASLVPNAVELAMVQATERDRELVGDAAAEGSRLGVSQVVRFAGLPATHRAWLPCDKLQMELVPTATRLYGGEAGFSDVHPQGSC